jgi:hypothetical protein
VAGSGLGAGSMRGRPCAEAHQSGTPGHEVGLPGFMSVICV